MTATERTFPNIAITSPSSSMRGLVRSRVVARRPIVRVETPRLTVEASRVKAEQAGMAQHVKLLWQISGTARFETAAAKFELQAGDAAILPMCVDYQFEMGADYNGLMLIFDPSDHPGARELVQQNLSRVIANDSAITASGAAAASLLDASRDFPTDRIAVEAILDLVFRSIIDGSDATLNLGERPSNRLRRAKALVQEHVTDHSFGPEDLAVALGVSRRTLYADFSELGLTPSKFIRRVRACCARQDIIESRGQNLSLTEIALRNGYIDSSSFSRTFKAEFGTAPSVLRANN